MTIEIKSIKVDCKEPECNNSFRWNGLGIKPPRCRYHENLLKMKKQNEAAKKYQEKRKQKFLEEKKNSKTNGKGAASVHSNFSKPKPIKKKQRIKPDLNTRFPKNVSNNPVANHNHKTKRTNTKWFEKETKELLQFVQYKIVNPYIRKRDRQCFKDKCISCYNENIEEAGHYYSIGSAPGLRLKIWNIHGQGHMCNTTLGGFGNPDYETGLINRHGQSYLHEMEKQYADYMANGNKLLRHEIIEIAKTYKYLARKRIWVFKQDEFDKYNLLVNSNKND